MQAVRSGILVTDGWSTGRLMEAAYSLCPRHHLTVEIVFGLRILPDGNRRSGLREKFGQFIALAFDRRVLAYDDSAARAYGERMGQRKAPGRPMSVSDGQIAAIARSQHLAVTTRNVLDFESCSVDVVEPFVTAG